MLSATLFLNECSTGTPLSFHGSDVHAALHLPALIYPSDYSNTCLLWASDMGRCGKHLL